MGNGLAGEAAVVVRIPLFTLDFIACRTCNRVFHPAFRACTLAAMYMRQFQQAPCSLRYPLIPRSRCERTGGECAYIKRKWHQYPPQHDGVGVQPKRLLENSAYGARLAYGVLPFERYSKNMFLGT